MSVTRISRDIIFRGEVRYEGSLEIEGVLEGKIISKEMLLIASGAKVKADLNIRQVSIKGEITGNVKAELVTISSGGKIFGDIECTQVQIDRGGVFNGTLVMP
jgi:cytoskeletal protein CcmA (bactofilin family)